MTTEEKYKEIVESRNVADGESKEPSGVKVDPPTEEKPADTKPAEVTEKQQVAGKKEGEEGKDTTKKVPTDYEKQQHELASMRFNSKKTEKALLKQIEDLKAEIEGLKGGKKTEQKKRSDFNSDDEYGDYLRQNLEKDVTDKILKQVKEQNDSVARQNEFNRKLTEDLDKIQQGLGNKIIAELNDPESVMSQIILDENGESMVTAIRESSRRADILALMQARPEIFKNILALPPKKQEYRIYALEDQIDAKYAQLSKKQQDDKEKEERSASLPTAGSFGVHGNGTTDISGLSTEERVARYKAEMRKKIH